MTQDNYGPMDHATPGGTGHRTGLWLIIGGAVLALAPAIYMFAAPSEGAPAVLWVVVGWGILIFAYGVFRVIRGSSALDHPRGGTDANGR